MRWTSKSLLGTVLLAVGVFCSQSCKKRPAQAMASDLAQAGYQLTEDDWFRACRTDDVEAMKKFLAAGFSDRTKDKDGNVGLHHAARGGAQKAAAYLLNRHLPIDERNGEQRTPLMLSVIEKQGPMVNYLLRQGSDPLLKDKDSYTPLMLAVREGCPTCVSELAPYNRNDLDSALLLASMEGNPQVIDALTNYGASVYARMEDGRTPLMISAENGQMEGVKILMDLGSSRFTTDAAGHTAGDLATAAGFTEIATYLSKDPTPADLSLESDEQVAAKMDAYVDAAEHEAEGTQGLVKNETPAKSQWPAPQGKAPQNASVEPAGNAIVTEPVPGTTPRREKTPARSLQGETLSEAVVRNVSPLRAGKAATPAPFATPPIVMRHYREREVPVEIRTVEGDTAVVKIAGIRPREVRIKEGQTIPGSNLVVVRLKRRMESSKLNFGLPTEVSVVDVRDTSNGTTREWIAGVTSRAHDPVALVEDAATGKRYVAAPGQRFKAADGHEFIVSDVRPNQMVIEDAASANVQTIPLSGPRG